MEKISSTSSPWGKACGYNNLFICVTRDDTQYLYVLYNKPSVIIQHVQCANNCSVADVSINHSITLPGAWDTGGITFTLYCGGGHLCIVSMDRADTIHYWTLNVLNV